MALSGSLNFLTASEVGIGDAVSGFMAPSFIDYGLMPRQENSINTDAFIPTDFVGLNTVIYEEIELSTNTVGPPSTSSFYSALTVAKKPKTHAYGLPAALVNRNGPYQHPSWKQIRGGNHPVARRLRLHNTMSIDMSFPDAKKRENMKQLRRSQKDKGYAHHAQNELAYNNYLISYETYLNMHGDQDPPAGLATGSALFLRPRLKRFYEPSVVIKHKPIVYDLVYSPGYYGNAGQEAARVRASVRNNMVFFENFYLNKNLKLTEQERNKQYFDIIPAAREAGATDFVFSKMIFPKSVNVFRPFKLEKANFEENPGLSSVNPGGYDREINRSFWRDSQPAFSTSQNGISFDGSSRTRTPELAVNSQGFIQSMKLSSSYGIYSGTECGESQCFLEGYRRIIQHPAQEPQEWNHTHYFIENGIIAHSAANTLTGSLRPDSLPKAPPSSSFINHETYNPYPIALLSMWPLDVRQDIFAGTSARSGGRDIYTYPTYLRAPIGGQGAQIGLTPHRMKLWNEAENGFTVPANAVLVFNNSLNSDAGSTGDPHKMEIRKNATASYGQFRNIITGTAGELVYSTKPTMFLHKQESTDELIGYRNQTASLQYNRHTFPYNTPFYVTNLVRGRSPFFNSYSEFMKDIKYIAREYSHIPEFRISEHLEYYYENYFADRLANSVGVNSEQDDLYQTIFPDPQFVSGKTAIAPKSKKKIVRRISPTVYISSAGGKTSNKFEGFYDVYANLNLLSLQGASPSSSSDVVSFVEADKNAIMTPSKIKYRFDTLNLKAESLGENYFANNQYHVDQITQHVEFLNKFSYTDNLTDIVDLFDFFQAGENTVPQKIQFTANCLKKLLPYKNFYPATKTVDIGNKFKNYISNNLANDHLTSSGIATENREPGEIQSFLEPFMAPGILYNSLKSGIGVNYPIYEYPPSYFAPVPFFSGSITSDSGNSFVNPPPSIATKKNTDSMFTRHVSSSFNYGGFQMAGASRCIPAILNCPIESKLPFAALWKPREYLHDFSNSSDSDRKSIYLTTDFLDLDINAQLEHPDQEIGPTGSKVGVGALQSIWHPGALRTLTGPRGKLLASPQFANKASKQLYMYETDINNFLCETMNFFLKEQSPGVVLPVAVSSPVSPSDFNLETNTRYYMEVSIRMGRDHVSCEGPRNAGIGGGTSINNIFANDNKNASMRGYIYGPPIECAPMTGSTTTVDFSTGQSDIAGETGSIVQPHIRSWRATQFATYGTGPDGQEADYESYFAANLQDPAYAPWTPPYFYGKSSLYFNIAPGTQNVAGKTGANVPEEITLDNLNQWVRYESFYHEEYITGSSTDALCKYIPAIKSQMMGFNSRMKLDDVMTNAMASYRIKYHTSNDPDGNSAHSPRIYTFCPNWVCPVLDFSSSLPTIKESFIQGNTQKQRTTYLTNSFHSTTTGKGLWGGYGVDPYDQDARSYDSILERKNKGIYFEIRTPYTTKNKKTQSSVAFTTVVGKPSYTGYYTNVGGADIDEGLKTIQTASLTQKLGYTQSDEEVITYKIGEMADTKNVSEAIVLIPYLEKPIIHEKVPTGTDGNPTELFRTREIMRGKHFLPIQRELFENILSIKLAEEKFKNRLHGIGVSNEQQFVKKLEKYHGCEDLNTFKSAKETEIYKLIDTIMGADNFEESRSGYQLPPEFDFINYKQDPFQMIIIPVDSSLNKQELIDIYQGIMPDSSVKAEKLISERTIDVYGQDYSQVEWMPAIKAPGLDAIISLHDMYLPANFLGPYFIYAAKQHPQYKALMDFENSVNVEWLKTSKDFYDNLKFMAFKIKQRSNRNYQHFHAMQKKRAVVQKVIETDPPKPEKNVIETLATDWDVPDIQPKRLGDVFGSNWPYDDFSLIEAVRMDIKFKVKE